MRSFFGLVCVALNVAGAAVVYAIFCGALAKFSGAPFTDVAGHPVLLIGGACLMIWAAVLALDSYFSPTKTL